MCIIDNIMPADAMGETQIRMSEAEKKVVVVGVDDSEESTYALQWTIENIIAPFGYSVADSTYSDSDCQHECSSSCESKSPFRLILVHSRPSAQSVLHVSGPGAADVLPIVEMDLKKIASNVIENAKSICLAHHLLDVVVEKLVGDARNVLCDAVDRHCASILVVGSRGFGTIKRAFLGSVSDYCARNAKCTVMIVKKPKI